MAAGAIYYDARARAFPAAEVVIVACNGVARRACAEFSLRPVSNGLANSSGLVGRNLMLHPWPMIFRLCRGHAGRRARAITSMWSKQFYETDRARGFVRGYTLQFNRGMGPANQAITGAAAGPAAVGARTIIASSARCTSTAWGSASPARISPRRQNRVTSIPC